MYSPAQALLRAKEEAAEMMAQRDAAYAVIAELSRRPTQAAYDALNAAYLAAVMRPSVVGKS